MECCARQPIPRTPEPDLVMEDPESVSDFTDGTTEGVLLSVQAFQLKRALTLIRPGDTVLDLGCGPASYLMLLAGIFPDTQFIGVDLSSEMLQTAENNIHQAGITNIRLLQGDICNLAALDIPQPDLIQSTNCLHHLPDLEALAACFRGIASLLKPAGGLFIFDLCRLRSQKTIDYLTADIKRESGEFLMRDYRYSLQAAFSYDEYRELLPLLGAAQAKIQVMKLLPVFLMIRTPDRTEPAIAAVKAFQDFKADLKGANLLRYRQLSLLFSLSGFF